MKKVARHTVDDVFFWYLLRHAMIYFIDVCHVLCMHIGSSYRSDILLILSSVFLEKHYFLIIIFLDMYIMLVRVSTPLVIYNYICSYMEFRMVCVASSSCSSTLVELVLVSIDTDFLPKKCRKM